MNNTNLAKNNQKKQQAGQMSSYANELMGNTSATPTGASTNNTSNVQTGSQTSGSAQNKNTYDENSLTAQLLRDQNWKALYDTKIQLANARALGQKYYQNEIQNSGFGSQGYGSSMAAAQNNNYANALAAAEKDYYDREMEITQDEINNQTEIDKQIVTYVTNAPNATAAYNNLINYGLLQRNEDGTYSWTDQWNNLDQERKGYILSALQNAGWSNPADTSGNSGQASQITGNKTGYTFDNLMSQTVGGDGWGKNQALSESTLGNGFNAVNDFINKNGIGTAVFQVSNDSDKSYTEYLLYSDGMYYRISQDDYNNWTGDRYRFYGPKSDEFLNTTIRTDVQGTYTPQQTVDEYSENGVEDFDDLIGNKVGGDGKGANEYVGNSFYQTASEMQNMIADGNYENGAMFLLRSSSSSSGYALIVYLGDGKYSYINPDNVEQAFDNFNGQKIYINGDNTSDVTGRNWASVY